jgi:hypothetical protein
MRGVSICAQGSIALMLSSFGASNPRRVTANLIGALASTP